MKVIKTSLLLALGSSSLLLNAVPQRVLIKNDTENFQQISITVQSKIKDQNIFGTSTNEVIKIIDSHQEIDTLKDFFPHLIATNTKYTITNLTIKVAGKHVNLGKAPEIRIIIHQQGKAVTTQIESLTSATSNLPELATKKAFTVWWQEFKTS